MAAITEREFALAKRILASFDLVMITEHMGWRNQTDYARALLWGQEEEEEGAAAAAAAEAEAVVAEKKRKLEGGGGGARMQHHNKYAAKGDDAEIDAETLRGLWRANYWDLLLYDYAQNLVAERIAAFEAGGLPRGDGKPCRAPVNDPSFRRDAARGGQDPEKPNPDTFLFTAPFCANNDYAVNELDERLGFDW